MPPYLNAQQRALTNIATLNVPLSIGKSKTDDEPFCTVKAKFKFKEVFVNIKSIESLVALPTFNVYPE